MSDVSFYESREEELLEREFREESQAAKSLPKTPRVKRRPRASAYTFSGAYRRRVRKMQ
jgi:hypothetical protein